MSVVLAAIVTFAIGSWNLVPDGAWVPSQKTVGTIQAQLEDAFLLAARKQNVQPPALSSFTFQYQGQIYRGRKIVFVAGFCEPPAGGYHSDELSLVDDGGACFFEAKYDIQTKRFVELRFNGVA